MAPQAGLLYVTMSPNDTLPLPQFHDWYNNEHGPLRVRLPFITSGFRYHAADLAKQPTSASKPEWMALYDITDTAELIKAPYTTLREPGTKTQREVDAMAQISVNRAFFDLLRVWKAPEYASLEANGTAQVEPEKGNVMVSVNLTAKRGLRTEIEKWYGREHIDLLSQIQGWRRSRLYVASSVEDQSKGNQGRGDDGETEFLALHEYAPHNGLSGDELRSAVDTEWAKRILGKGGVQGVNTVVHKHERRVWGLYYTFGPAPRDVKTLAEDEVLHQWRYSDGRTRTAGAREDGWGAVESYITTRDGVDLKYSLEGTGGDDAPLLVLINSVLVEWAIWDGFVNELLQNPEFRGWRVLRYNSRGRGSNTGKAKVTLDVLTSDVIDLLDALRVKKATGVVGVSLGGATALSLALKHPDRVGGFVACDTNAKSPAGNKQAWSERIAMAEEQQARGQNSLDDQVGSHLALATVKRWFPDDCFDGGQSEARIQKVEDMIARNSLEGFKSGVEALFDYDLEGKMSSYKGKGAFLVGQEDGKLPQGMKAMAEGLGKGVELKVIQGAGHLPMVERPEEVADFVASIFGRG